MGFDSDHKWAKDQHSAFRYTQIALRFFCERRIFGFSGQRRGIFSQNDTLICIFGQIILRTE